VCANCGLFIQTDAASRHGLIQALGTDCFWPEADAGDMLLSAKIERWVAARKSLIVC